MAAAHPRISVVMPVHNGARFLREAVESILAQTFDDFELIVVDDGSTDGSLEIIEGYGDPRIRVHSQENRGIAVALNRGIDLAEGVLIARMDADDVSEPCRLERQHDFLTSRPEVAMVTCAATLLTERGCAWRPPMDRPGRWRELTREEIAREGVIWHGAAMYRKADVQAVGGYRPETVPAEDLDLWLRLRERGGIALLHEPLFRHRRWMHPAAADRAVRSYAARRYVLLLDSQRAAEGADELERGRFSGHPSVGSREALDVAFGGLRFELKVCLCARDWLGAWRFAAAMIALDPLSPKLWLRLLRVVSSECLSRPAARAGS